MGTATELNNMIRKSIYWIRRDFRINDNPALNEAVISGQVLPIYILDNTNSKDLALGSASKYWLYHSINSIKNSLGGNLSLYVGNPKEIMSQLIQKHQIDLVLWNRCYEPWQISRDKELKSYLQNNDVEVKTYSASLLWEPWEILKKDGGYYKVFSHYFYKGCLKTKEPRKLVPLTHGFENRLFKDELSISLEQLGLLSNINWHQKLDKYWQISEVGANDLLSQFLGRKISSYKEDRNYPAKDYTSKLSPYLHFGQISPHQIWQRSFDLDDVDKMHFCSELGWREFAYYLLYHFPTLPSHNFQNKFDKFVWQDDATLLESWKRGKTGIPIIDAGMRELWETGYMHNRVRMIVASFLVKNLLIDWRHGAKHFFDCLVDADLANNSAAWQWVAGSGADAAPYFRIFNPALQADKFDIDKHYIKKFVPELRELNNKYVAEPYKAPVNILSNANIELGVTYPYPIIDLSESRKRALSMYKNLRSQGTDAP